MSTSHHGDARAHEAGDVYTQLIHLAPALVVALDEAGRTVLFNAACESLTGYRSDEVIGAPMISLLVPERFRDRHLLALRQPDGPRLPATGVWRTRSGRERVIAWRSFALARPDGHPLLVGLGDPVDAANARLDLGSTEPADGARPEREALEDAQDRLAFLADASTVLALSIEWEATLESVADLAVPRLADWCVVDILDDTGAMRRLAVAHVDPEKVEVAREVERRYPSADYHAVGPAHVIRTGQSELCPHITDATLRAITRDAEHLAFLSALGMRSYMSVALSARGRTFGAVTFGMARASRAFTAADLALAEDLGRRAGLAIDNARLYREAQHANRIKDEFLATLSHELRTPLTSILAWARTLRTRDVDGAIRAQALETIERNVRAQVRLIDDLLDIRRIVSGTLTIERQRLDLHEVVRTAVDAMRPTAHARGIALDVVIDEAAAEVSGDPARMEQVVFNLLSNAIKFTPERGHVELRLERVADTARIVVRDDGRGIDAAFLPHVFDPFRQADSSTTRNRGGLGLGLAIVKRLVALHGGTVHADSRGAGLGTTVTVELPLTASERDALPVAARPEHVVPARALAGVRVLLVDDDVDTRHALGLVLQMAGAAARHAGSASDAVDALAGFEPDVLVLDIGMPRIDGYALLPELRARLRGRDVPAIALTAYASEEHRERALRAGYQMHLAKPVDPAILERAIAILTRRSA